MKKNRVIMVVFFTVFAYGMDKQLVNTTTISVRYDSIFDEDVNADLIVIGKNQQQMLQPHGVSVRTRAKSFSDQTVYVKNAETDSVIKKEIKSKILRVSEPKIVRQFYLNEETAQEDTIVTYTREQCYSRNGELQNELFIGDKATDEALKDLAVCYRNLLSEGIRKIGPKHNKKIAIAELSREFGLSYKDVAAVIIKEIVDFVESHSHGTGYSEMDLFITEEESESNEYERRLSAAVAAQDKCNT